MHGAGMILDGRVFFCNVSGFRMWIHGFIIYILMHVHLLCLGTWSSLPLRRSILLACPSRSLFPLFVAWWRLLPLRLHALYSALSGRTSSASTGCHAAFLEPVIVTPDLSSSVVPWSSFGIHRFCAVYLACVLSRGEEHRGRGVSDGGY